MPCFHGLLWSNEHFWVLRDLEELIEGLFSCKDDKIWMLSTAVCRVNKGQNELSTKELKFKTDFFIKRNEI